MTTAAQLAADAMDMDQCMSMPMCFYSRPDAMIWFSAWTIKDAAHLYVSCLFVLLFGVGYEYMKLVWARWDALAKNAGKSESLLYPGVGDGAAASGFQRLASFGVRTHRFLRPVAYAFHTFVGYALMLIAMTYNLPLIIALCIGFGLGYFLFADKYPKTASGHQEEVCH